VYGTESAFIDGDDTPWSKAFLASAYASRGIKARFTSGGGAEAVLGRSDGHSMLYLEARCLMVVRGAGSQGVQNGSISLVALPMSLPGGVKGILAENLLAAMQGLEVASGNDALASHSDIRKTAKLMLQFLPGTDFITSGYSAIPKFDNMFGGGNFDSVDLDDWYTLQRDMVVDGGILPANEEMVLELRRTAAKAVQSVYYDFGFPPITDEEVSSAIFARDSRDIPERDRSLDIVAANRVLNEQLGAVSIADALAKNGFKEVAERIIKLQHERVIGDYLQPAAVFDERCKVSSAINDPNSYGGPGTGYRVEETSRWEMIANLRSVEDPRKMVKAENGEKWLLEKGEADLRTNCEVIIGVGPAYGHELRTTINGLCHKDVLLSIIRGVEDENVHWRIVRIYETADCASIGHIAAKLSGSGVAIGLQSKGTLVIHHADLEPLDNLELYSMAPILNLKMYRRIGENAAKYAKGEPVSPADMVIDNEARLRLIIKTTIMHQVECRQIIKDRAPIELVIEDV
jgi:hypothetical protein